MKNILQTFLLMLSLMAAPIGFGQVPVVTAVDNQYNSSNGIRINFMVNPNNASTTTRINYGLSANLAALTSQIAGPTMTGNVLASASIDLVPSLTQSTIYYYNVVATNASGSTTSEIKSFTGTSTFGQGSRAALSFTSSTPATRSITLNYSLNANGIATTSAIFYGTSPTPNLISGGFTSSAFGAVNGSAIISDLNPSTTYYFFIRANNILGATTTNIFSATTLAATAGTAVTAPTTGLVAFYDFEGNYKSHNRLHDLIPIGTVLPSTTTGKNGQGVDFDSADARSLVNESSLSGAVSGSPFTICYWTKADNEQVPGGAYPTHFDMFGSGTVRTQPWVGGKYWDLGYFGSATTFQTTTANVNTGPPAVGFAPATGWHHIAIVHRSGFSIDPDRRNFLIFVDGVQTGTNSNTAVALFKNTTKFFIGGGTDIAGLELAIKRFKGSIDEFYIYDRVLTTAEIIANRDNVGNTIAFAPIITTPQTLCSNSTLSDITINTLGSPRVYTAASGGSAIALTTAIAATTYHVSQVINGIESPRTPVQVLVAGTNTTLPVITSPQTFCRAATVGQIAQPYGGNIRWYKTATSEAILAINEAVGNETIYASLVTGACESARIPVQTIINTVPVPKVKDQVFCGGNITVADLIAEGTNLQWRLSENGAVRSLTNVINATNDFYVSQIVNGCESARAIITVTIGNNSTTYNGTWSNGTPTIDKAVIFASNFTANTDLEACSVLVNPGVTLNMVTNDLTVRNAVTVSSTGSITFANTGNLIQLTDSQNTGNIETRRNTSIKRLDYTFWGSPVAGQNAQVFSPNTLSNRFYTFNEATNTFNNSGIAASNFVPGTGYSVRSPNNFTTTATNFIGIFTGIPNNGDFEVPVTYTAGASNGNGYNLLGNPYPSAIDAQVFLVTNPGALYFWTKAQTGAGTGNYAAYNLSGGLAATVGGATAVPNGTISKGQGFMYRYTTAASGNVIFNNLMRSKSNVNQFFRAANSNQSTANKFWLNLTNSEDAFSQTLLSYDAAATNGFDASYDATQLNNSGTVLSTILDAKPFAIQTKGFFNDTDIVPMSINIETAGNYSISIDHTEGIFNNQQNVFLKDNATGATHNLSQSAYNFVATAGASNDRFELRYVQGTLGINTNIFAENNVIAFKNAETLKIKSSQNFDTVLVYDIRGVLLFESKNINNNSFETNKVSAQNNVLLVKIKSGENAVTKKIIF